MTGLEIRNSGDGIWDDGEWISWAWIYAQIQEQENAASAPVEMEKENEVEEFEDLEWEPSIELLNRIYAARNHYEHTLNVISPDWGSIGESYVAEKFGVNLCSRHTEGHDGRLGDELVEIKTITPHKRRPFVTVKRSGNFSVLAVVRVADDCGLEARFVRRKQLPTGDGGKRLVISWNTLCRIGGTRFPSKPA